MATQGAAASLVSSQEQYDRVLQYQNVALRRVAQSRERYKFLSKLCNAILDGFWPRMIKAKRDIFEAALKEYDPSGWEATVSHFWTVLFIPQLFFAESDHISYVSDIDLLYALLVNKAGGVHLVLGGRRSGSVVQEERECFYESFDKAWYAAQSKNLRAWRVFMVLYVVTENQKNALTTDIQAAVNILRAAAAGKIKSPRATIIKRELRPIVNAFQSLGRTVGESWEAKDELAHRHWMAEFPVSEIMTALRADGPARTLILHCFSKTFRHLAEIVLVDGFLQRFSDHGPLDFVSAAH